MHRQCGPSCSREAPRYQRAPWRRNQHRGQKGDDGVGYAGYKHQKGEKVIAITDNHGYVLASAPVAPAGHLAHERGATCRASACLPPHSPPYWGSRSARRRIYGVRPIPMGGATTRGEDAMARVSLDLENKKDLKGIQA